MIKAAICFALAVCSMIRLHDLHSRSGMPTGAEWMNFIIAIIAGLYFI